MDVKVPGESNDVVLVAESVVGEGMIIVKESALGRFFHRVAMSVCVRTCPLPMRFFCVRELVHAWIICIYSLVMFFSKHWPSGPMLSISQFVRTYVCLYVCSFLRYRLTVFFPPLPEVGFSKCLEIQNHWGKVMEINGLRFEHFIFKVV